jgi:hypothetical protein
MTRLEQKQAEYIKYLLAERCPAFKTEVQKLFESEISALQEAEPEINLRDELIKYDEYLDEYVDHKRSEVRVDMYMKSNGS